MVASVLTHPDAAAAWEELLRPTPLDNGAAPEQRVVFYGISWNSYLAFDRHLGEDRSSPRLYFLANELEIMTTSNEHERIKKWIGDLLADYFFEAGIEIMPRGQATLRLASKEVGAEPDESWSIGQEKEFPDLVIEIGLTSGGVNKLEIYRRFGVPEVWFWRGGKIEIFTLNPAGAYEALRTSRLLPGLDIALLEECVGLPSWQQARQTFRARHTRLKAL